MKSMSTENSLSVQNFAVFSWIRNETFIILLYTLCAAEYSNNNNKNTNQE